MTVIQFRIAERFPQATGNDPGTAVLVEDPWDDWFRFETTYVLVVFDTTGHRKRIGEVKIAQKGMGNGHAADEEDSDDKTRRATLPYTFRNLSDEYFSLGQDADYYARLNDLGPSMRSAILKHLRDMAYDETIYADVEAEPVVEASILRTVSRAMLDGQFRRIARGGAKLTKYEFAFSWKNSTSNMVRMDFAVDPGSRPPTNLHAIIGRNGTGKTRALQSMARAIVDSRRGRHMAKDEPDHEGGFDFGDLEAPPQFSGLVLASFSAFDEIALPKSRRKDINFASVGFPSLTENAKGNPANLPALARALSDSVKICLHGDKRHRWRVALRTMESDPIFAEANFSDLISDSMSRSRRMDDESLRKYVLERFSTMSSGHKISLIAVTQLVEVVEERSLVLLDEPESHLHPPLLASFLRAVSDLLMDRNGVGIVATHSPVALQEIPRSCVSILRRAGDEQLVERPTVETFGENVSVLTRDAFGLEVTRSGFHRLLVEAAQDAVTFEEINAAFNGQLGGEARALAYAILADRRRERSIG